MNRDMGYLINIIPLIGVLYFLSVKIPLYAFTLILMQILTVLGMIWDKDD